MKKLFLLILFSLFMCVTAFAGETSKELVTVTGGFKQDEITFDLSRDLTGRAPRNTVVTVTIGRPNPEFIPENQDNDDNSPVIIVDSYNITVGSLGFFSKDIPLYDGENIVAISAVNESLNASWEAQYTIVRKSLNIKQELESLNILLPGQFMSGGVNNGD